MTEKSRAIDEEAIDWLIRLRDPAFADWDAFTVWLEIDPAHAEAYQEAAATDDAAEEMLGPPGLVAQPAPVVAPELVWRTATVPVEPRRRWRPWAGGALAAGVAGLIGYLAVPQASERYGAETAPGARRVIELEPGTSVTLNGGTRITLDRKDRRYAALERDQALFDVRHDPDRPFRVEAAGTELVDAGTRFEVTRTEARLDLAVAEGLVIVNPEGEGVRVPAGRALAIRASGGAAALTRVAPVEVGAWREGRLYYDGDPLAEVATDLSRNLGVTITAAPDVAVRPFNGVISLDASIRRDPRLLQPLLGVAMRRSDTGWVLSDLR